MQKKSVHPKNGFIEFHLRRFILSKLENQSFIEIDLSLILGIGGAALVFRQKLSSKDRALKIIPTVLSAEKRKIYVAAAETFSTKSLSRYRQRCNMYCSYCCWQ